MDYQTNSSPSPNQTNAAKGAGVRRVNNMPIFLGAGVLLAFLLVMALVMAGRSKRGADEGSSSDSKAGNASLLANAVVGDQGAGIIPESGQVPSVMIARPDDPDAPPQPPGKVDETAQRLLMAKLQQLQQAINAKTGVQVNATSRPGSNRDNPGPAQSAYEAALARTRARQQQRSGRNLTDSFSDEIASLRGAVAGEGGAKPNNDIGKFAGTGSGDRWRLDSEMQSPRTPYELRAGFVIPAILVSGINSELPGQIIGQVSQDVYDTPTGKYKLIPQGSRLVGSYSSDVAYGQSRLLVAWQRIVFPDGKTLDLGAMPGTDSAGYAGFGDKVNHHYLRIFGSAILMSGVTAGITLSQPDDTGSLAPNARSELSAALGQQLGQVTVEMLRKNINISPTLEIRPGFRFNVMVVKDLTFDRPYQAFSY